MAHPPADMTEGAPPASRLERDPSLVGVVLSALGPWLDRFFEPHVRGLERVPERAALFVANHNAGVMMPDLFVLGRALHLHHGMEQVPYVLAHDVLFQLPIRDAIVRLGAVPASPSSLKALFEAGRKAIVYPGGDREVMRPYRHRHRICFGPRRGYVRMAIREGVPIVPVVTAGAHEAFLVLDDGGSLAERLGLPRRLRVNVAPTVLSVPWGLTVGLPPPYLPVPTRIVTEVLDPISFDRAGDDAASDAAYVERCHEQVVEAMQAALDHLVATEEVGVRARFKRRWPRAEPFGRMLEGLADAIVARAPFRSR